MRRAPTRLTQPAPSYVERVRFRWERELEGFLSQSEHVGRFGAHVSDLIELSHASSPRFHELATEVMGVLGWTQPFKLYRSPKASEQLNAQALLGIDPIAIRLIGPVAHLLDDNAIRALLGHEVGHHLAHGPTAHPPSTLLRDIDATDQLSLSCRFATEITADRFGLLASQDLEAMADLEVASMFGDSPKAMRTDPLQFLEECCAKVDEGSVEGVYLDSGYPTQQFRLYAARLFSTSDVYQDLTGRGSGENQLADIDALLRALAIREIRKSRVATRVHARPPVKPTEEQAPATAAAPEEVMLPDLGAFAGRALEGGMSLARVLVEKAGGLRKRALEPQRRDPGALSPIDDLDDADDLELRFRELERTKQK
ncbi:MAG: hypothetical protein HOV80_11975 [Polyangiaceae bacterium]|nr:hypothetical protein [Polyangiaceae bacterium]